MGIQPLGSFRAARQQFWASAGPAGNRRREAEAPGQRLLTCVWSQGCHGHRAAVCQPQSPSLKWWHLSFRSIEEPVTCYLL